MTAATQVSVVVLTYNRVAEVTRSVERLLALPDRPDVIVVDNGSNDGTVQALTARFAPLPGARRLRVVALPRNLGAAARNAGVQQARTPYVAFSDDDTWWAPGSLTRAAELLDAHPRVAVLSARILVGPDGREDPTCTLMSRSPLASHGLPGPALIGFMAGASVFRRQAFCEAGGYEPRLFIGGEEALLALDLLARGWSLVYCDQLSVHHHPSAQRDAGARQLLLARNALWVAWLRRPWRSLLRETHRIARSARDHGLLMRSLAAALAGLPWVLQNRRVVPPHIEQMLLTVAGAT